MKIRVLAFSLLAMMFGFASAAFAQEAKSAGDPKPAATENKPVGITSCHNPTAKYAFEQPEQLREAIMQVQSLVATPEEKDSIVRTLIFKSAQDPDSHCEQFRKDGKKQCGKQSGMVSCNCTVQWKDCTPVERADCQLACCVSMCRCPHEVPNKCKPIAEMILKSVMEGTAVDRSVLNP